MKILILGGGPSQLSAVEYAVNQGHEVYIADYFKKNIAHSLAREVFNISTTDVGEIRKITAQKKIEAIVACGSDAGCETKSIIYSEWKRAHNSLDSVRTLVSKDKFREFLNLTGIQRLSCWNYDSFRGEVDVSHLIKDFGALIVKPTDSNGSKGVTKVTEAAQIDEALNVARMTSRSGSVIVEPFFEKKGFQICGDGYFEDNKIKYLGLGDGWFNDSIGGLAPYAESFPSSHDSKFLNSLKSKIENILREANFNRGCFNVDAIRLENDSPFIIEIAPRSGGNFIPDLLRFSEGVDLISAVVEESLSDDFIFPLNKKKGKYYYANYVIHSIISGILSNIWLSSFLQQKIIRRHEVVPIDSFVESFSKGSYPIGYLLLKFNSLKEMHDTLKNINDHIVVELI